jgi:glycine cleavage system aminomethyltransferase T
MSNKSLFGKAVCEWSVLNSFEVPAIVESFENEVYAIRNGVALSDISHTVMVRISGPDAFAFIDRIVPCVLTLKPNQMRQTVFINSDGELIAEGYVCRDETCWMFLVHGIAPDDFILWLQDQKNISEQCGIELLNTTHCLLSVNGPFAWELMAEMEEPEIISLPYLSLYHPDDKRIIFRAGETGEFGYHILIPRDNIVQEWEKLISKGCAFNLVCAGYSAIEYCMLENSFFNIYREGKAAKTPAELQIQWRVSYRKEFSFSQQLQMFKKNPLLRRLTAVYLESEPLHESKISLGTVKIGTIICGYPNCHGKGWIGLAMIDLPYAVSGVHDYSAESASGPVRCSTLSMPLVNNRSLYVDPQIHSYADRDELTFPKLSCIEVSHAE